MGITYLVICIFKFCINESMANNLCFDGIQCLSPPTLCHIDGVRKNKPGEEQEWLKGLQEVSEMGNLCRRLEGWRCLTEEGLDSQPEGGVSVLSFTLVTLLPASLRNWELSEENFRELWATQDAPGCSALPLGAPCSPRCSVLPPRCSVLPSVLGAPPRCWCSPRGLGASPRGLGTLPGCSVLPPGAPCSPGCSVLPPQVLRAPLGCSVLPPGAQHSRRVLNAPPKVLRAPPGALNAPLGCSALPRPAGTSSPPGSPFPPGPPLNSANFFAYCHVFLFKQTNSCFFSLSSSY